mmetsp:Transcript_1584/g.5079  ORF Transcript_1584/g.5079 Transcript_1584/m.5079 type:complete len:248 (+) Transcript_1584:669-1412(+)
MGTTTGNSLGEVLQQPLLLRSCSSARLQVRRLGLYALRGFGRLVRASNLRTPTLFHGLQLGLQLAGGSPLLGGLLQSLIRVLQSRCAVAIRRLAEGAPLGIGRGKLCRQPLCLGLRMCEPGLVRVRVRGERRHAQLAIICSSLQVRTAPFGVLEAVDEHREVPAQNVQLLCAFAQRALELALPRPHLAGVLPSTGARMPNLLLTRQLHGADVRAVQRGRAKDARVRPKGRLRCNLVQATKPGHASRG